VLFRARARVAGLTDGARLWLCCPQLEAGDAAREFTSGRCALRGKELVKPGLVATVETLADEIVSADPYCNLMHHVNLVRATVDFE
jgi:hypothetical protein